MKSILFITVLFLSGLTFGQGIEYEYDLAGNRYMRKVFVLGPPNEGGARLANPQIDLVEDIAIAHGYENFDATISDFGGVAEENKFEDI